MRGCKGERAQGQEGVWVQGQDEPCDPHHTMYKDTLWKQHNFALNFLNNPLEPLELPQGARGVRTKRCTV